MKPSQDFVLIPGLEGLEGWRLRGDGEVVEEAGGRRSPHWVGLATQHTYSIPVRLLTQDPSQQEASVLLELEAAGLSPDGLAAHRFEIRPVDLSGRDGSALVFVTDGQPPADLDSGRAIDAEFAPAALFHPLKPGVMSIWREEDAWVIAIPHANGSLLHSQALCGQQLDGDTGIELRCILSAMELSDVLPRLERCEIEISEGTSGPDATFQVALDLPVSVRDRQKPKIPEHGSRLVPEVVVVARQDRQRRRMTLLTMAALVLVMTAALSAFAARLYIREQAILTEKAEWNAVEPDLQAVRNAQAQFEALDATLNPDQFIVELFYQLISLLPPQGIRITRFEVRADSLIIDGVASSPRHAIDFRGELTDSEFFREWGFDQGFSQNPSMQDGSATFRAEGRLRSLEEGIGELVGAP